MDIEDVFRLLEILVPLPLFLPPSCCGLWKPQDYYHSICNSNTMSEASRTYQQVALCPAAALYQVYSIPYAVNWQQEGKIVQQRVHNSATTGREG